MTEIFIYFLKQSYHMTLEDLEYSVIISNTYYRTASYAHQGSIYSQVHKYWDIDTILTFLALYTTTMDFKWNEQDVL